MRMPRPIVRIVRKLAGLPGPGDNFWYEPIGAPSATGIQVTATSALAFPAVFACVRVLAETIASLPLLCEKELERGLAALTAFTFKLERVELEVAAAAATAAKLQTAGTRLFEAPPRPLFLFSSSLPTQRRIILRTRTDEEG